MSIFDFNFLARAVSIIDFPTFISALARAQFLPVILFNRIGRLLFLSYPVTTLNSLPRRRLAYLSFPSPTFSLIQHFGIVFPGNLIPSPSSGNSAAIAFPLMITGPPPISPRYLLNISSLLRLNLRNSVGILNSRYPSQDR